MDKPVLGVDVSKDWLDVARAGAQDSDQQGCERIANTPEAIAALLRRLDPALVAFEPTGGYERALLRAVQAHGALFVRVHPNALIAYRASRGIRAKTDPIDAHLIAAFAGEQLARHGVRPGIAADAVLRELAARRRQLVEMLQAERCRLQIAGSDAVKASLAVVVSALEQGLRQLEQQLAEHIAADPALAQLNALLQTVKGIGPITAMTLLADLPELGQLDGKQIAALAGLAPQTRQSGKMHYRAHTGHGRPSVRKVLFNAARSAIQASPPMKAFYDRLTNENKRPGKVALTAVMRKLLVTANAIARDRTPWKLNAA